MECRHAYLKANIDYVLCDKEPQPSPYDRKALAHAVCAHQAECPKAHCHRLTANWVRCVKLAERSQNATGETFATSEPSYTNETKMPPRTRRKPKGEE